MIQHRLYSILALAGTIPFLAAALFALLGIEAIGPFGSPTDVALSYGLAIASFLAGTHWAIYLLQGPALPLNLFISSNVIVLGAWFPFVLLSAAGAIAALLIAFLCLLYIDYRLLNAGIIEAHYLRVRSVATATAATALLVVMLAQ